MDKLHNYFYTLEKQQSSVLAALPIKTLWYLFYIVLIVFVPFTIKTIIYGQYVLSVSFSLFILTASVYLYYLTRRKIPPISVYTPLLCMCFSQSLAVFIIGINAIFWAYPSVITFYFVLPARKATVFSLLLLFQSSISLYVQTDIAVTLRFLFSLMIVLVLILIISNHILALKSELIKLSTTDPLTGAFNRRHLDHSLEEVMIHDTVSLLIIDIDHFKQVNDTHGHETGDQVLKCLVDSLHRHSRKDDLVFRMGGEEFVMILPHTTAAQAKVYAEYLRLELAKLAIGDTTQTITVSIGASELADNDSPQIWLKQADLCLYQAKAQGRDKVVVLA